MIENENESGWKIKKELSLGDLLAIAIALLSIVSVYFKVDTRLIVLENERTDRREAIARFEAKAERKFEQIDSKLDRLLEAVLYNHSPASNGTGPRK